MLIICQFYDIVPPLIHPQGWFLGIAIGIGICIDADDNFDTESDSDTDPDEGGTK